MVYINKYRSLRELAQRNMQLNRDTNSSPSIWRPFRSPTCDRPEPCSCGREECQIPDYYFTTGITQDVQQEVYNVQWQPSRESAFVPYRRSQEEPADILYHYYYYNKRPREEEEEEAAASANAYHEIILQPKRPKYDGYMVELTPTVTYEPYVDSFWCQFANFDAPRNEEETHTNSNECIHICETYDTPHCKYWCLPSGSSLFTQEPIVPKIEETTYDCVETSINDAEVAELMGDLNESQEDVPKIVYQEESS